MISCRVASEHLVEWEGSAKEQGEQETAILLRRDSSQFADVCLADPPR